MRTALAALLVVVFAGSALASEEEIHHWRSATVSAPTQLFGDVEVKAAADPKGNLTSLEVVAKAKTTSVPAKFLATLPPLPLASLEIRSEVGYDKDPWLYIVFRTGARTVPGSVEVHIAMQGGKLVNASLETFDGKGSSKRVTKKP